MQYVSLGNSYEGVRLSINNFLRPGWFTEGFKREIDRVVNPRGEVSKMVAMQRVKEIRETQAKITEVLASMDKTIASINDKIERL